MSSDQELKANQVPRGPRRSLQSTSSSATALKAQAEVALPALMFWGNGHHKSSTPWQALQAGVTLVQNTGYNTGHPVKSQLLMNNKIFKV